MRRTGIGDVGVRLSWNSSLIREASTIMRCGDGTCVSDHKGEHAAPSAPLHNTRDSTPREEGAERSKYNQVPTHHKIYTKIMPSSRSS